MAHNHNVSGNTFGSHATFIQGDFNASFAVGIFHLQLTRTSIVSWLTGRIANRFGEGYTP
jgi:hypothetical protein